MTAENPASCGICGALWDFRTDWIGRLVAQHPVTRCVPRVEGRFVECTVCEKEIELLPEANQSDRRRVYWCSDACHEVLREKRREADRLTRRKYDRTRPARPHIPAVIEERHCVECGKGFTPANAHAQKQFLCSDRCRLKRGNAKKKKAA